MSEVDPSARTRAHAFTDDALGDHDAVGLAEEIRAGRVSRREAAEAAIERIRGLDEQLHGLACERFEAASAEASASHPGYFAGQPSLVKDNSDVEGLPTQYGTRAFVARPAAADGDLARVYRRIGLTPVGKTRLSEFGLSASAEFVGEDPVRNPWHTGHTAGASSAGSAAFVAAGAVPMAHANDGGGSIRIPAACTGLVGLKPSRGRTPTDRLNREMPVRIVHDGVLTRTVRDTAAFLRETERVHRHLTLPPVGDVSGPSRRRLRVGLVLDSIGGRDTDPATIRATEDAAALLEDLGHHVEPVAGPAPEHFADDFLAYWGMLALALSRTGRRSLGPDYDRRRNDNLTRGLAARAARGAWRLPLSVARLARAERHSRAFFAGHDIALSPTLGRVTPELGWLDPALPFETLLDRLLSWVTYTPFQNVTGDPAVSLPSGFSAAGLPIGVQLSAARGHDRRLLEVAFELEAARPFARIQD